MPVEDRVRTLEELRGLVGRLGGASVVSYDDAKYMARLVRDLGYSRKVGLVFGYFNEGQYGNVVALGENVLAEEARRAADTEPNRLFEDD